MFIQLGNTCTNIVHVCLIAEWVSIGEIDYNFYALVLSHVAAKTRCLQESGKLFEPKDEQTNNDVFMQAGKQSSLSQNQYLIIFIGLICLKYKLEFFL